ncbi:uncharacterized protein BDW43DRAFT_264392 [Aspergillus alliaceus]|uniref:uncharacterized protein n=1 Tax=Petromyces alliaceus TaxID=209559 RepID=UPI0012A43A74|nr:uncharacterized protein BDW43DRAFT_264392 [Aspergillus alliaceus]KAB8237828.1 hypothetical protein BDW43DRAFT_264392 [Aspergillus alliaceus]
MIVLAKSGVLRLPFIDVGQLLVLMLSIERLLCKDLNTYLLDLVHLFLFCFCSTIYFAPSFPFPFPFFFF